MAAVPEISIYFFADTVQADANTYSLLIHSTQFADAHGFSTVWVPERHFQPFGGLYPSPSVAGAALAVLTQRIRVHAGSVVAPLNDALRVAEDWAMIDNLSQGRAGIAFASGWHTGDFVLAPQNWETRREYTYALAADVRRLWAGESITRPNAVGEPTPIRIYPRPMQRVLPTWLTAQSDDTFVKAGELGYNVLTNFNRKTQAALGKKLALYREAMQRAHGRPGHVTLMAHTYVAQSDDELQRVAVPALATYLDVNLELQNERFKGMDVSEEDRQFLKARAVRQFIKESGVIVVEADLGQRLDELVGLGVDEVACLIDFGVAEADVLRSLDRIARFIARHRG